MALVFSDPSNPDALMEPGLTQMRCSSCKELKPCCACQAGCCSHDVASAFPPSCVRWRRGACKQCRAHKARNAPVLKRKLESARHRYGSIKSMTLEDAERLLQACCGKKPSDAELTQWRLVKKDADSPFSRENATWVKQGVETEVKTSSSAATVLCPL